MTPYSKLFILMVLAILISLLIYVIWLIMALPHITVAGVGTTDALKNMTKCGVAICPG